MNGPDLDGWKKLIEEAREHLRLDARVPTANLILRLVIALGSVVARLERLEAQQDEALALQNDLRNEGRRHEATTSDDVHGDVYRMGKSAGSAEAYHDAANLIGERVLCGSICGCGHCGKDRQHWLDCAVHNEPAMPAGECDCGVFSRTEDEGERGE